MNGMLDRPAFFEDQIILTGLKICENDEAAIRSNAASLMHKSNSNKTGTVVRLISLQESIVFSPPICINNVFHRQSIPHKEILGFFRAPSFNDRMILVVQDAPRHAINLYGIQLSSPIKTQEISALLGETQANTRFRNLQRKVPPKTIAVHPSDSQRSASQVIHSSKIRTTNERNRSNTLQRNKNYESNADILMENADQATRSNVIFPISNGPRNNNRSSITSVSSRSSKIPGIITSDIEYDWDDMRSMSRAHTMDESDETISIGYYNDEGETKETKRMSIAKDDSVNQSTDSRATNAWMENITYISKDPVHGNQVASNGSIYMYVAQQVNPRYLSSVER